MRVSPLVLAVVVTALYGYGAQATIAADLARVRLTVGHEEPSLPIYDGGTLAPITIEARRATRAVVVREDGGRMSRPRG